MKYKIQFFAVLLSLVVLVFVQKWRIGTEDNSSRPLSVVSYSTTADQSELLKKRVINAGAIAPGTTPSISMANTLPTIKVKNTALQTMDGFGYTLTGGSAELINAMSTNAKQALLNELFGIGEGSIGVSYLRLSVGASDLSSKVFSYNDLPNGRTDLTLEHFSIAEEKQALLPVLKDILNINPHIKIMASPWSPPTWMKTNGLSKGGKLTVKYYEVYAQYLVKYIQVMAAEGVVIDAITVQNEPLHPGNNPSLHMTATEQATFIKDNLGPAFKNAGIQTKIVIYDHNADRIDYPISILNDPEANQYIDGSAFHLYGGEIDALSEVHELHPDKNIYFTEQWIGAPTNFAADMAWHMKNILIGAPRNWSKTVLEWNLAADPESNPHTLGGCERCLGALTIDGDKVERNPAYYIIAHASKHVRPGAVRLHSNELDNLPNVAFKTPKGETVIIVFNDDDKSLSFVIDVEGKAVNAYLDKGAVGTYVFPPY